MFRSSYKGRRCLSDNIIKWLVNPPALMRLRLVQPMGQITLLAVYFLLIVSAYGWEGLPSQSRVLIGEGSIPRVLGEAANINSSTGGAPKPGEGVPEAKADPPPVPDPSKENRNTESPEPKGNPEIGKPGNNGVNNGTQSNSGIGPGNNSTKDGTVDSGKEGDHKSPEKSGKGETELSNHEPGKKGEPNGPEKNKEDGLSPPEGKNDTGSPVKKNDDTGVPDKKRNPTASDTTDNKDKTKDARHAEGCDEVHSCTDGGKMTACLRASGNEMQELSLLIQNKGENLLNVNITVPAFLKADPLDLKLERQQSKTVQVFMVKHARNSDLSKIVVNAGHGNCILEVPSQSLHFPYKQSFLEGFSYSAIITPMFGVYLLLFTVLAIGGTWMCCKFRGKRKHGDGIRYQELEMNHPESNLPISVGGKLEAESTDGWDEVWDDNWEDAEAARPSSRPIQSLSSKGLAARRSNKDGWDNSWDD